MRLLTGAWALPIAAAAWAGCAAPCDPWEKTAADGSCVLDEDTTAETGDTGDTGATDSIPTETDTGGTDTSQTETGDDSGTTVDTDTDDTAASGAWMAPDFDPFATTFTVPADRGHTWALDEDFRFDGFSVPHIVRLPDGRYAMFINDMRGTDTFLARSIAWSDDGLSWTEGGAWVWADDFATPCQARLEDSTAWMTDADTWTVLFVGATEAEGGDSQDPRHLCRAVTDDFEKFTFDDAPTWTGAFDGDVFSVPAALTFQEEGTRIWYNGDVLGATTDGPGIRRATVDAGGGLTDASGPLLEKANVDPTPVWVEGGGVRLYHTWGSSSSSTMGIGWTELDEKLDPTGTDTLSLPSPGECSKSSLGACYTDPVFVRLDDDTLLLYFGVTDYAEDGTFTNWIGRARATD